MSVWRSPSARVLGRGLAWFGIGLLAAACTARTVGELPAGALGSESGGGAGGGVLGAGAAGSKDSAGGGSGDAGGGTLPGAGNGPVVNASFEALEPAAYLAKVKGLLTGLTPTEAELSTVSADPSQLEGLIATWQALPEYEARMVDFFTMAFQQGDVTAEMIGNVTPYEQGAIDPRVIQSMRESFGRTAMQLVKEGAPFTDVLTTNRFMMTPALMVAMTWLDERQSGDGGGFSDVLNEELGDNAQYTMQGDTKIPLEQSADPKNANFLKFYSPQVAATKDGCHNPLVVDKNNRLTLYTGTMGETLMMFFMGTRMQNGFCVYSGGQGVLDPSDFTTWRMVKIRQPAAGEKTTRIYEIPKFRSAPEIVFSKPHVGFYTTPAFLYTWQTNTSNQARVTANQTMIAAVGQQFDGVLTATPVSIKAVASEHAKPGSDCYNCHITMDPMRQYFRSTFSYFWGLQTDKNELNSPGIFAFDGESHVAPDIADLGKSLAKSARFAPGWLHKLCTWADGAVCDPSGSNKAEPSDPEFVRISKLFQTSGYSWNALVQELFSSPLVTYAASTKTTEANGVALSVAKKAQLCKIWDLRLGLNDVCGLHALPSTSTGDPVKTIATVLPSDSYSRGQTMPTLANDPGLFFYSGVENICTALANRVVDASGSKFQSAQFASAIGSLVHDFMGVYAPRDAEPLSILTDHYQAALKSGVTASVALKSTFIVACMSPNVVSIGQ